MGAAAATGGRPQAGLQPPCPRDTLLASGQAQAWTEAWPLEAPPRGLCRGGLSTPSCFPHHTRPFLPAGLRPSMGSRPWSYQEGPTTRSLPHTRGLFASGVILSRSCPSSPRQGPALPLPAELPPPIGVFAFLPLLLQTVSSLRWYHCVSMALVSQLDSDQYLSRSNLCAM